MNGLQKAIFGAFLLISAFCAEGIAQNTNSPLVIGDTFTIDSKIMGEKRIINVYLPPGYKESPSLRVPVLYMPDGGLAEDFLHVAGLVQVSVVNETMRPFLLVGIENTERRRDMTGPTENEKDKKIAPRVGGSALFRKFIRDELMPEVKKRYRTTDEKAMSASRSPDCLSLKLFCSNRICSTPTSPLMRASGGTITKWLKAQPPDCGLTPD